MWHNHLHGAAACINWWCAWAFVALGTIWRQSWIFHGVICHHLIQICTGFGDFGWNVIVLVMVPALYRGGKVENISCVCVCWSTGGVGGIWYHLVVFLHLGWFWVNPYYDGDAEWVGFGDICFFVLMVDIIYLICLSWYTISYPTPRIRDSSCCCCSCYCCSSEKSPVLWC